jgi:hypothetical protein
MSFEKPQKGNPYSLTVKQHTFPRASIARFSDSDGRVSVSHISTKKCFAIAPDDQLFCAQRAWDQWAEEGYMKNIEDDFQTLADNILSKGIRAIGQIEKQIVNDFFALWNIRAHRKAQPILDQQIKGIIGLAKNYTKDEQELLEKNHIGFIRPDFKMPGRSLSGINIQMNIDRVREQLEDAQWGILEAQSGEFLVPDNFSNARIVPISPTLCLFSQSDNATISKEEVAAINHLAIDTSIEYFFARDFSKCPR